MSTLLGVGKPPFLPGSVSPTQLGITDLSSFRSFCPKSDIDSCATENVFEAEESDSDLQHDVTFKAASKAKASEGYHPGQCILHQKQKKTKPTTAECLRRKEPVFIVSWPSQM